MESIFNQKQLNPHEIIIIDDNSKDNTFNMIENYLSQNECYNKYNIRCIQNTENKGSGYYNWIKGIQMSTGDLIHIAERR